MPSESEGPSQEAASGKASAACSDLRKYFFVEREQQPEPDSADDIMQRLKAIQRNHPDDVRTDPTLKKNLTAAISEFETSLADPPAEASVSSFERLLVYCGPPAPSATTTTG